MKLLSSSFSRTLVGTVAAGAMAVSSASPALARDRNDDGIDAGEVIAGALIIGGIAAVAAAASNNNNRYDNAGRYGNDYRYDRAGYGRQGSRQAVEACVQTAERDATRWSRGRADVTQVTRLDRTRYGYTVKGRIAVDDRGNGWRSNGWSRSRDRYDTGTFTCKVRYGRIADLDFSGIRGLR